MYPPILPFALAGALLPAGLNASPTCTFESCLAAADVPFLDATAPEWPALTTPLNIRVPVVPRAVVPATSVAHVQGAVQCAARHGVKVAPKSGGHSYANSGLGGEDGHVVVLLDRLFGVHVREDGTAVVKAGSRLGHVATDLFAQGGRGVSHGLCPTSRTHGLTLDAVVGATVVLADGSVVHASEEENVDLFWALRGAGSSFGIVVEFELKTFAVPEEVSWFRIRADFGVDKETALEGFKRFQDFVESGLPAELNMRLELLNLLGDWDNKLEVLYHGSEADARAVLEPLTEPLKLDWDAERTIIGSGNWMDGFEHWADPQPGGSVNVTGPIQLPSQAFFASSLTTKKIPDDSLEAFVDYWQTIGREPRGWFIQIDVHGDATSAVAAVPKEKTSYAHRDKLWLIQFADLIISPLAQYSFLDGFMSAITDGMADGDWGRYANYIDAELSEEEAVQQYYGDSLPRLGAIKAAVDPADVFHFPQGIRPVA
ncbi:hypothetical protein ACHAQA_004715 [Verticillium albo-atrum]